MQPAILLGIVLALPAAPALASGREGEALVQPILWMVGITLVMFVACVVGGVLQGAFKASRSDESVLKGIGRGLLKGLLWFVIACAVSYAVLTALGLLWLAWAYLYGYVINPEIMR